MATERSRPTVGLALSGLAGGLVVALASYGLGGEERQGLQLAAAHTARFSFALFIGVYLAGPLLRITGLPLFAAAVRQRRGLGLAFASAHFVHLATLTAYVRFAHVPESSTTLLVGGFAYACLVAMALTSNDQSVRWLGARTWRILHAVGMQALWIVFVLILLGGTMSHIEGRTIHLIMLGVAIGAAAVRLSAIVLARRAGRAAPEGLR